MYRKKGINNEGTGNSSHGKRTRTKEKVEKKISEKREKKTKKRRELFFSILSNFSH